MQQRRSPRGILTWALSAGVVGLALVTGCARPSSVAAGDDPGGSVAPGGSAGTARSASPSMPRPSATPSSSGTRSAPLPSTVPAAAMRRALGCPASMDVTVARRAAAPAWIPPAVVVVAHCASGAGSPPSGVYVLTPRAGALTIAATLVASRQEVQVDDLSLAGTLVHVDGTTYSGPNVPRCCPDVRFSRSWTVTGGVVRPVHP